MKRLTLGLISIIVLCVAVLAIPIAGTGQEIHQNGYMGPHGTCWVEREAPPWDDQADWYCNP